MNKDKRVPAGGDVETHAGIRLNSCVSAGNKHGPNSQSICVPLSRAQAVMMIVKAEWRSGDEERNGPGKEQRE